MAAPGSAKTAHASPLDPRRLESLWVRLKLGARIRPRDAEQLRRLSVPPFDQGCVYELDALGYVVAVGLPGKTRQVNPAALLAEFQARFGAPEDFMNAGSLSAR